MAARKKTAKAKAKRRNVRAGKPPTRVKRAAAKKKQVAKKRIARRPPRAAPKAAAPVARGKTPAAARQPVKPAALKPPPAQPASARQTAAPGAKPASAPERTSKPPATAPVPAAKPAPAEERIGVVSHYFSHLSVAALLMESGSLRVGDTIHVKGHTTDFTQKVDSLQVDHAPVSEVLSGQDFGVKVKEHAREHDVVYKVIAG